jgi:hypothetical protein
MHTYENSVNKRYIQQKILDQCAGIKSNALVLAGPNAAEYLELLTKYIGTSKSKIYSYENNFAVYAKQLQLYYSDNKYRNVIFRNENIINADPQRYIDLDLMCQLRNAKNTLIKLFNRQQEEFGHIDKRKVFNFSISSLYRSPEELIPFIEHLLTLRIKRYEIIDFFKGKEYLLFTDNSKYQVRVYSYWDTSLMLNVLIQY